METTWMLVRYGRRLVQPVAKKRARMWFLRANVHRQSVSTTSACFQHWLAQLHSVKPQTMSCKAFLYCCILCCGKITEQPWLRADHDRAGRFGGQLEVLSYWFQCRGWIFTQLWVWIILLAAHICLSPSIWTRSSYSLMSPWPDFRMRFGNTAETSAG